MSLSVCTRVVPEKEKEKERKKKKKKKSLTNCNDRLAWTIALPRPIRHYRRSRLYHRKATAPMGSMTAGLAGPGPAGYATVQSIEFS